MVTIEAKDNIIYSIAEDKLDDQDYDKIVPLLEETIRNFKDIRWYFEMKNFHGWTPSAMWEDAKLDFEHKDNFEKIAMVGSEKWEDWLSQLMKPFTKAEIKFFKLEEKELAKAWIKS
ncbi:MAG: STAS/SEC14 domain-containing protein [Salegentibacter sp.]